MKPTLSSGQTRCPRCRGNLGLEYDPPGGWDVVCLQCGFRHAAASTSHAASDVKLFDADSMRAAKAA